jgi:hypothetical protein
VQAGMRGGAGHDTEAVYNDGQHLLCVCVCTCM